jgi:hypothetical protein
MRSVDRYWLVCVDNSTRSWSAQWLEQSATVLVRGYVNTFSQASAQLSQPESSGSPYKIVSPLKPCLVPLETYCPECGIRRIMHEAHKPFLIGKVISFSISVNSRSAAFARSCDSLAPAYAPISRRVPRCESALVSMHISLYQPLLHRGHPNNRRLVRRGSYESVLDRPRNWYGTRPSAGTPSRSPRLCTFSHVSQRALNVLYCRPQR